MKWRKCVCRGDWGWRLWLIAKYDREMMDKVGGGWGRGEE